MQKNTNYLLHVNIIGHNSDFLYTRAVVHLNEPKNYPFDSYKLIAI